MDPQLYQATLHHSLPLAFTHWSLFKIAEQILQLSPVVIARRLNTLEQKKGGSYMYHAHIYFELGQQSVAEKVHQAIQSSRDDITAIFPLVTRKVGPHDKPMFEVHFNNNQHGFIEWLAQHRAGLSVLIHPVTGNDLADHTSNATWLGKALHLHTEMFEH